MIYQKNDLKTYNNIRNTAIGQGNDCTTRWLLGYPYFEKYYKLIAINLSKQQKLDADPKQYNKSILLEIWLEKKGKECISLIMKQKKQF